MNEVKLPKKKVVKVPRMLTADAYTLGSDLFQHQEANEKSVYYITFRKPLHTIDKSLYEIDDNRMIFVGLGDILEELFYDPITMEEIEETETFLATFKANINGLKPYKFNKNMWIDIVENYNGRPPIHIEAMPEGSVVYPNEPVVQITSGIKGKLYGELAAYFESKILHVWATSERATANRHWFKYLVNMISRVNSDLPISDVYFIASTLLHDFGDRAGICGRESEVMGKTHFYSFCGSDTVAGGYLAWLAANKEPGVATSVYALAHRTVQPWKDEGGCYTNIYEAAEDGDFISMVADCYDFYHALENYLLPLALRSSKEGNNKVVVSRPDSGNALEQVIAVCELAEKNGLYTEINGFKYATTLKVIEGDSMTWKTMKEIFSALEERGFAPFSFCLFGVGGGLRNNIKRDDFSAKYALASVGFNDRPVIKLSEVDGKRTLPGPFKILRDTKALETGITVDFRKDSVGNAMVEYYNGARIEKPYGIGMDDNFLVIKDRILIEFDKMPKDITENATLFPSSNHITEVRLRLTEEMSH